MGNIQGSFTFIVQSKLNYVRPPRVYRYEELANRYLPKYREWETEYYAAGACKKSYLQYEKGRHLGLKYLYIFQDFLSLTRCE